MVDVLLSYEITTTSFFLMKDGFLREASNELTFDWYSLPLLIWILIWNMVYFLNLCRMRESLIVKWRKVIWEHLEILLKTCGGRFKDTSKAAIEWKLSLIKHSDDSVKAGERKRRAEDVTAVKTRINHPDQPLQSASELPKFWASTENKIHLQQFFIKWISKKYDQESPLYLGGCHVDNRYNCYKVSSGGSK